MITKRELCLHIIKKFASENNQLISLINEHDITSSSSLAVAMEYLEILQDEDIKEYASSRGGIFLLTENGSVITLREMINLLPVERENEFHLFQKEDINEFNLLFEKLTESTLDNYLLYGKSLIIKSLWKQLMDQ
jgi:hypothetical protein